MTALQSIFYWLFDTAVAQALLLALAALYICIDPQPARRVRVTVVTLLGSLLIAILTASPVLPRWSVHAINVKAPERLPWLQQSPLETTAAAPAVTVSTTPITAPFTFPWREAIAIAFLLAAAVLLARFVRALVAVHQLRRRSAALAHHNNIPILANNTLVSPLACGLLRPAIITPPHLAHSDLALAHELAHIHHCDPLIRALERLAAVVLFYQPAFYLLRRQLHRDQEHLADIAAARLSDPITYAESLLQLATHARPDLALAMAAPKSDLLRRVEALFRHGQRWHARTSRGFTTLATLLALAAATLAASLTFSASTLAGDARAAELRGVAYLLRTQSTDGGWLTHIGTAPTALAGRALLQAGVPHDHPQLLRAKAYLLDAQQPDGSFRGDAEPAYQTAVTLGFFAALNDPESQTAITRGKSFLRSLDRRNAPVGDWYKSGRTIRISDERSADTVLDSYGRITYAQWKSLTYADLNPRDRWVQMTARWLESHWSVEHHPGTGSHDGHHFYLLAAARTLNTTGTTTLPWRADMTHYLLKTQSPSGAWTNGNSPRWLEDQPALVTAYALLTLQESRPQ